MKINFRKFVSAIAVCTIVSMSLASCGDDDNNSINLSDYQKWREQNDQWVADLQKKTNPDGTPYYATVVPVWNPGAFVLMHYFNDRSETADNLVPLYTSVVDVIYEGYNMDDEIFDSSKSINRYGRLGVQRFSCNGTIQGWAIAMENMHVGDSCEVIVPYQVGYGTTMSGSIKPYTSMRFNLRLVDIYRYEGSAY